MNKINELFANKGDRKLLSLYFCAGCPQLECTGEVIKTMERRGIDFIEVGIPFIEEYERCVVALFQPLRIVVVGYQQYLYAVGSRIFQFLLRSLLQWGDVFKRVGETLRTVGHDVEYVVMMVGNVCAPTPLCSQTSDTV